VWFSNLGFPHSELSFPYNRYGPGSQKNITFNNLEDIWNEIDIMVEAWTDNKFSLGRNLYFNLPQFCDPKLIVTENDYLIFKEYIYQKEYNLSIADNLDSADARTLDLFDLIHNEVNEIKKYLSEEK
tara:strand:- start:298 stop:678 length:381 start_codon:yes stop_codon:yes gene_type:complete